MQTVGSYVLARENNVVLVDFRRTEPPTPDFPGAGALRAGKQQSVLATRGALACSHRNKALPHRPWGCSD